MQLTLFQRDECPLCDEAYTRLLEAGVPDFDPLWIDGDLGLEALYGTRVPVLRRVEGPVEFGAGVLAAQVRGFLGRP